ncbi:MAG: anti-sigma factor [Blastocatellia bacterium]
MTRDEAKELFPLYAVGALDADELREVEIYLRDASASEKAELTGWREVAAMLPLGLPEIAPPEHLKARLLDRIAQDAPAGETTAKILPFTSARRPAPNAQRWLLMAASILLACTSAFLLWRNSQVAGERDALVAERNQISEELERERREKEEIYASLTAASKIVPMAGKATPQANAKVVWDTKQQVWKIFIVNLPAPPSDKDYQLWYVTNKAQKISAAVFRPDPRGHTMLTLTLPREALTGLAATAVTLEPKGGSPQPTTSNFQLVGQI